jgi:hypothetical protein
MAGIGNANGDVGMVDFHLDRYAQRYTHPKVVQELDPRPRFETGSGYRH